MICVYATWRHFNMRRYKRYLLVANSFRDVQSNLTLLTECVKFKFNYLCGHISTHWDLFQQILKHMLDMKNWNYLFDMRLQNILNYKWIQCGFVLSVDKCDVYFFLEHIHVWNQLNSVMPLGFWFHNQAIQLSDNPNIGWPNIKSVDVLFLHWRLSRCNIDRFCFLQVYWPKQSKLNAKKQTLGDQ